MTEYVDIYCPECDAEVHACLRNQPAILSVRGEEVGYSETVAVCPTIARIEQRMQAMVDGAAERTLWTRNGSNG